MKEKIINCKKHGKNCNWIEFKTNTPDKKKVYCMDCLMDLLSKHLKEYKLIEEKT